MRRWDPFSERNIDRQVDLLMNSAREQGLFKSRRPVRRSVVPAIFKLVLFLVAIAVALYMFAPSVFDSLSGSARAIQEDEVEISDEAVEI